MMPQSVENNSSQKSYGVSPFSNPIPPNPSSHRSSQFSPSQIAAAEAHAYAIAQAELNARCKAAAQATNAPSVTGSGNAGTKRVPRKPIRRPRGVPNPNTGSPARMLELKPAARCEKKPKLNEKQLQQRVGSILPPSALYTQLREFESRVDAALVKKKVEALEAVKNPPSVQKTLRIYVFNTFANQSRTNSEMFNAEPEPPTWTMKIVGRILEEGMDPDLAGLMSKPNPMYPKFSSFLKSITISLDQNLYRENHMIVWDSSRSSTFHEGFEVKRIGDEEFVVKIRVEMNYKPEKFILSSPLMEVLGTEVDTRNRIVSAIWQYIKVRKLQNADDPSSFNCDPLLLNVFGEEKVSFSTVLQKISNHLSPIPPILLEHKIKLSGDSPAGNACYDVLVDVPLLAQKELKAKSANTERKRKTEACDEAIFTTIRKIHEHRKRRAFFLGFSESPVEFIGAFIKSHGRDLKLLAGDANRNVERESRADFYKQSWVGDAVIRYLNGGSSRIADKST